MPGLLSWQKFDQLCKRALVSVFDAVCGAVCFLCDLFKGGAVQELAAEDPAIQGMEDVLIDQHAQL